jgi:lauroyl/myristoyl acyltransferase
MRNLIKINLFAKEFYISNIANVLARRTEAPLIFSILARENIFSPSFILSFSPPLYEEETRDIALISKIIQNYLNKYTVQWYTPWMESNIKYGFT